MISHHKIPSRDTFVLLTAQLVLLTGAIIGWARNYLLGTTRWTRLFDSAHAAGIALVGAVLLWTAIRLLRKRPGLPESWLPVIHHRWLLGASLAGLLLAVTGNALFNTSRLAPALSVLTALFGALILLQSAYDRGFRNGWLMDVDLRLDPLRSDSRFIAIRQRIESDLRRARSAVASSELAQG